MPKVTGRYTKLKSALVKLGGLASQTPLVGVVDPANSKTLDPKAKTKLKSKKKFFFQEKAKNPLHMQIRTLTATNNHHAKPLCYREPAD